MSTCIEHATYINSAGDKIDFGKNGLYLGEEPALHSWSFSAEQENRQVTSLYQDVFCFDFTVQIIADTDEQANEIRNRLHDVLIVDAIYKKYGQLIYNGYTLKCWVVSSEHSDYIDWQAFGEVKLKVMTDKPEWIKDISQQYTAGEIQEESSGYDYVYDYEHDYEMVTHRNTFLNPSLFPSDFKLEIFGPVSVPQIYISGHLYSVDVVVEKEEYLTIDSKPRTVILTEKNGRQRNCFNFRNRDSYLFEKIPVGENIIYFESAMQLRLTVYDKRGEPKWM